MGKPSVRLSPARAWNCDRRQPVAHRGDHHAAAGEFFRQRLGKGVNERFARIIHGHERAGHERRGGGNIQNASFPSGEHGFYEQVR